MATETRKRRLLGPIPCCNARAGQKDPTTLCAMYVRVPPTAGPPRGRCRACGGRKNGTRFQHRFPVASLAGCRFKATAPGGERSKSWRAAAWCLFPDRDGYGLWEAKAKGLAMCESVTVNYFVKENAPEGSTMDLADFILDAAPREQRQPLARKNPRRLLATVSGDGSWARKREYRLP
jgi:hypothetical protein